jgi:hypothetical protein
MENPRIEYNDGMVTIFDEQGRAFLSSTNLTIWCDWRHFFLAISLNDEVEVPIRARCKVAAAKLSTLIDRELGISDTALTA